jgi:hypothetical protein
MTHLDKGIAVHKTISERVDAYQVAVANITEAYAILAEAQKTLDDAFGRASSYYPEFDVLPGRTSDVDRQRDQVLEEIGRKAWRHLINLSGIRKVLSVKRAEELDKKLYNDKLDEINHENVAGMLTMLAGQGTDFAEEAVKEVYEYLRPGARGSSYKTNQAYARWRLGKKVILTGAVEHGYGGKVPFRVGYYRYDMFRALDKVFHLLDGRGDGLKDTSYLSPLIDAVNTSETGEGQTDYFTFKAHHNGNLHLTFRRPELVDKLNRVAGGGSVLHD